MARLIDTSVFVQLERNGEPLEVAVSGALMEPHAIASITAAELLDALRRARIVADPRKFRDYVLVPGLPGGKDRIFLGRLGYRPYSSADAWELARLYEQQARDRIAHGDVHPGISDEHGRRCTIVVNVRGVALRAGWILRVDDVLWLTTPFSGFARTRLKG